MVSFFEIQAACEFLGARAEARNCYIRTMPHRTFTLDQVAHYLHLTAAEVERLVKEAEMPHTVRAGKLVFQRGEIDAWASQRILGLPARRLDTYHEQTTRSTREIFRHEALIPELLAPDYIDLALTAKTKASVIHDVVEVAARTGRLFDPRELQASVEAREALCSTALPEGLALLHARHLEAYRFEGSFLVLGRTLQDIHFGSPDGRPTRLFFLICCEDDRIHLHCLARLCLVAMKTNVVDQLMEAADGADAFERLVAAERSVLPGVTDDSSSEA